MEINCDYCNKTFIYNEGKAHYNRTKNHYCSTTCLTNSNIKHGFITKTSKRYEMWCSAKKRAKLKGLEFDLEVIDIPEIPEYCPILNIKIIANTEKEGPQDSSPSLDRLDNTKGYIKENITIISNRANRIKADSNIEELEAIINYVRKQNERI